MVFVAAESSLPVSECLPSFPAKPQNPALVFTFTSLADADFTLRIPDFLLDRLQITKSNGGSEIPREAEHHIRRWLEQQLKRACNHPACRARKTGTSSGNLPCPRVKTFGGGDASVPGTPVRSDCSTPASGAGHLRVGDFLAEFWEEFRDDVCAG